MDLTLWKIFSAKLSCLPESCPFHIYFSALTLYSYSTFGDKAKFIFVSELFSEVFALGAFAVYMEFGIWL